MRPPRLTSTSVRAYAFVTQRVASGPCHVPASPVVTGRQPPLGPAHLTLLSRCPRPPTGVPPAALTLQVAGGGAGQAVPPELSKARLHYSATHSAVAAEALTFAAQ